MATDLIVCFKDDLQELSYPRINSLSDIEASAIFEPANRCFLLSWLLKQLDEAYETMLKDNEDNKALIGELLCCTGLCTSKQKDDFIVGKLTASEQISIFERIFKSIKLSKNDSLSLEVAPLDDTITLNDIEYLKKRNLNLFPMYGEIKRLGPDEKQSLLESLNKEKMEEIKGSEETKLEQVCDLSHKKSEIYAVVDRFKHCLPEMNSALKTLKQKKSNEKNENIVISEEFHETLKKCSEDVAVISRFVDDMKVLREFQEECKKPVIEEETLLKTTRELKAMVQVVNNELSCLGT